MPLRRDVMALHRGVMPLHRDVMALRRGVMPLHRGVMPLHRGVMPLHRDVMLFPCGGTAFPSRGIPLHYRLLVSLVLLLVHLAKRVEDEVGVGGRLDADGEFVFAPGEVETAGGDFDEQAEGEGA